MLVQYKVGFSCFVFLKQAVMIQVVPQSHLSLNSCFPWLGLHVCISMLCCTNATSSRCWLSAGDGSHSLSCAGQALYRWTTFSLCKCNILKYFLAMYVGPTGSKATHFCAVYAQHKAWHPLKVSCCYCLFKGTELWSDLGRVKRAFS